MMAWQIIISICGAIGFAVAAYASFQHARATTRWGPIVLRPVAVLVVLLNSVLIAAAIRHTSYVEAFRQGFEATLVLASLLALVALITELTRSLRGLDVLLFAAAALLQLSALLAMKRDSADMDYNAWFISHPLAFAISGACFIAGGSAGAIFLIINKRLRTKRLGGLLGKIASLESLERFGRWTLLIGFPLFTYGILTGFCQIAQARAFNEWMTDPFVILTIVTWIVYAIGVLAIWFAPQLRGRRAAVLATCGMGLVIFVFIGTEVISTVHR